MAGGKNMLLGDGAVLLVALIWGATNVVMRGALEGITPFWFCALRFIVAWVTVAAVFPRQTLALPVKSRIAGIFTGAVFSFAYLSGAVALLYTTAGNESFIISMSVVFVPLAVWVWTRRFPGWHLAVGVLLCLSGMAGLVLGDNMTVNFGDMLAFVSMLFVTAYILLVQKFVAGADPYGLSSWQACGVFVASVTAALIFEPFPAHLGAAAICAILYAGTIGFALTLVLQTVAQKYTTPTHVAILLSTSGIFGSLIGVVFLGEPMTWRIFIASALILAGVLTVEAVPAALESRKNSRERA